MGPLIEAAVAGLESLVSWIVRMIQESADLSAEQKAALYAKLEDRLTARVAQVKAAKFHRLPGDPPDPAAKG